MVISFCSAISLFMLKLQLIDDTRMLSIVALCVGISIYAEMMRPLMITTTLLTLSLVALGLPVNEQIPDSKCPLIQPYSKYPIKQYIDSLYGDMI